MMPRYTDLEKSILNELKTGESVPRMVLIRALGHNPTDADSRKKAGDSLKMGISRIRKKMQPVGEDLICEIHRSGIHYRWVRLMGRGE